MFSKPKLNRILSISILSALCFSSANAQLSTNPDKFLGNITTRGSVNGGGYEFKSLWNQLTPENETKWQSIQGSSRTSWSWGGADNAYNYAKNNHIPFKFHTLVWGSQYPSWMDNLSTEEQYKAIVAWYDAVKARYPDLEMIDVVNEAISGHAPAPFKNALGGDGETGYDWIIKAFEMAYERWPNAILIYNDYNTFQWQKAQFIDLVKTLRDAGAPIDAYGCQSHDVNPGDITFDNFKAAMVEIQNALKIPMYSTEFDIASSNDNDQLQQYQDLIPYMWEAEYCAGITLWGYIYGSTWTTDGNSGIIKNGSDRPAMTWLRNYMKTDAAKNAKSPFPGMKKEASIYIKPEAIEVERNDTLPITLRASLRTKTIDSLQLFANDSLINTLYASPFTDTTYYVPTRGGRYNLKAIAFSDTLTYERVGGFNAYYARAPFKINELPGTIEAEDFDYGREGYDFHDSDKNNEGDASSYRPDNPGVDVVKGNGGQAIGYTNSGEWLEYTVNVAEAGVYTYEAYVSSGATNSSFKLQLNEGNALTDLTETISVPQTGEDWSTYQTIKGRLKVKLNEGKNVIRLSITGSSCNIDKIVFEKLDYNENIKISLSAAKDTVNTNTNTKLTVSIAPDTIQIANVKIYNGDNLIATLTEAPYETTFKPTKTGIYKFTAVATDARGYVSDIASFILTAYNQRAPYGGTPISIPGILQIENFDKGGEGFTFHDTDSNDEGNVGYRNDNEGVDIVRGNDGYAIGYTSQAGEWLEYTVNVKTAGTYSYTAFTSSGASNSGFRIGLMNNGTETTLATVSVPNRESWDTYYSQSGTLSTPLNEGTQIIRVTITGPYCNIDKIQFTLKTGVKYVTPDDVKANGTRYNLGGAIVGDDYKGIVIIDGKKVLQK